MLRGEHLEVQRNVTDLARAAADLSDWSSPDTPDHLRRLRDVLCGQLLPHAEAEENVLHPFVDKVLGAQAMTATMVQDHRATHRHIDALAELAADAGTGPPTERGSRHCTGTSMVCGRSCGSAWAKRGTAPSGAGRSTDVDRRDHPRQGDGCIVKRPAKLVRTASRGPSTQNAWLRRQRRRPNGAEMDPARPLLTEVA